jgi:cytoskeletal protein RodZ
MSNFGATFRKARETAGLPLEKIAAETRISTRFLQAIESESFELLPGGIFNRGFIRSYAEYLGLDPEQAVADYDRMSATVQEPLEVLRNVERESSRKSDRYLIPAAAAILVVSVIAYYVVTRKPATNVEEQASAAAAAVKAETPPAEAITAPIPDTAPKPEPVTVPVQQPPAVVPSPPPPPQAGLALDVNAKNLTWIKVTADGTVVFADVLQSGTERRFSAERSINITIGNAAGATLKINGRDLGRLGTEGQVREFRITPENASTIQG